ncbi:sulfate ABC transporter ATPase [Schaalia meyeri]|uniref:ABC transporter ATP-binding protein n=1 Tax=Schaalia meyeri TaxID=52773 RepID=A0AAP9Y6J5_9ACTO|nr:ABC transporter ATP-binding protein [Schaalia meyeri]AKU64507.1 sulfate ABC transporter ATPase [Schaalia meyeri]OFQ22921.1 multidrug ABC transporter ATP-binding protein [Actinomyces sp. HMSC062G12]QQC43279.1 ABC transporter ATP-binding protein [Schaalia meyeri]SDR84596.1 ABC-2 type transport system ATP-binding protein [Schaalia meyeri]
MTTPAISAADVTKCYGSLTAVDGVSLEVSPGEIFGIIGPNGAGKTTFMECLEGLRVPTSGTIKVLGEDPAHPTKQWRERIGVQLQTAALPPKITVNEAMALFASMYSNPADPSALLQELGIAAKGRSYVDKLSGGQRQRVFIALALLGTPELVFLDELTTALDPQARLAMWDVVRSIRQGGATVVMTTHYMEEAEALCDRVAVIDHGRLIALDTVPGLIGSLGKGTKVQLRTSRTIEPSVLDGIEGVSDVVIAGTSVSMLWADTGIPQAAVSAIEATGTAVADIHTSSPGLEDVFLSLTGRDMRQEA